jgi:hypothetical protein
MTHCLHADVWIGDNRLSDACGGRFCQQMHISQNIHEVHPVLMGHPMAVWVFFGGEGGREGGARLACRAFGLRHS